MKDHYLISTDSELISQLFHYLEEVGVKNFVELEKRLATLKLKTFTDLANYASGPDCEFELAVLIEEILDRLRMTEPKRQTTFTSSKEVGNYLATKLAGHKQEEFWCYYLDNANNIVAQKQIAKGTVNRALVHPRDVFAWAVVYNCASLIVVHNHPSGNLLPSENDLRLTKGLEEAGNLMQIDLLDHFIVGKGQYLSMKENKMF